jgi:hypothetical protein
LLDARESIPAADLLVGLGESAEAVGQLRDVQSPEGSASLSLLRNHLAVLDRFEGAVRDFNSLQHVLDDSRFGEEPI